MTKPPKPTKKKPLKRRVRPSAVEKRARVLLAVRSEGVCETQATDQCTGRATVCSHRKRRSQCSQVEMWSLTNLLHSCLRCELYLTDHGSDARVRSLGWTVASTVDPARVPVWRRDMYVWLIPGGSIEQLDRLEIEEWIGAA